MALVIPRRFEVWWVNLSPTIGSEIRKTRPCVIVSPDQLSILRTVTVVPLTTSSKDYLYRVSIRFLGRDGQAALDQIRTVDKRRLISCVGVLPDASAKRILFGLREMFAE